MAFSLKCPACRQKFPWDPVKGFPEYCPNEQCVTRIAHDRDDDDIVVPFIRSAGTNANDALYRQMEQASEHRAEQAAQMAGVPVSEMSGLKITNLNGTRHEGDVAAIPVSNSVTQRMDQLRAINPNAQVGFAPQGHQFAASVAHPTGIGSQPDNNMGLRTRNAVRGQHTDGSQRVTTSEIPINEIHGNPNFRSRV